MHVAAINGQSVAFDDTGGGGPVVILAHGFFMDRSMFAPQVAALRDRFRVITWDERGFGDTKFDGENYTYWDLADDCLALLDHLAIDRAVVGGMSQGGFISLRVALRAPDRVQGLLLLDTQAGTEDPEMIPIYQSMIDAWVADGPSVEIAEAVAAMILDEPDLNKTWIARWMTMEKGDGGIQARALLTRDDVTGRLSEIVAPALVVHGTADASIPMEKAEALADGLSGCAGVVPIQDGTHASNLTHPGAVNDAIITFLDSLSL